MKLLKAIFAPLTAASISVTDFNALKAKVNIIDASLYVLTKRVNLINSSVNSFEKVFKDIEKKHEASTGLKIQDIDYIGEIISNDI